MSRVAWAILLILLVVGLALPSVLPVYLVSLATEMLIFALLAMSLDLLVGYLGLASLGHAAFFGVAGYTIGLVSTNYSDSFWITLPLGLIVGALTGAVIGALSLRARGGYFLMVTLALAQVMWGIAFGWSSVTGGEYGIAGIPSPNLGISWLSQNAQAPYYIALVLVVIAGALLWLVVRSPVGLIFQGIRESEERMRSLGYDVRIYKYLAFIISATFASLAGTLWVYYSNFINPDSLHVVVSANALIMVILGGAGTLFGAAIGGALIVFLESMISASTERWLLILGAIYVATVMFTPRGIFGPYLTKLQRLRIR